MYNMPIVIMGLFMWHNKKHKYKEYEGQDNITVDEAELVYIAKYKGWAILDGGVITNRTDAYRYAHKLNRLIKYNRLKRKQRRFLI